MVVVGMAADGIIITVATTDHIIRTTDITIVRLHVRLQDTPVAHVRLQETTTVQAGLHQDHHPADMMQHAVRQDRRQRVIRQ